MQQKRIIVLKTCLSSFISPLVQPEALAEFFKMITFAQDQIILVISGLETLGKSKIHDYNNGSHRQAAHYIGLVELLKMLGNASSKPISNLTLSSNTFTDQSKRVSTIANIQTLFDSGIIPVCTGNILDTPYDEDNLAADLAILCQSEKLIFLQNYEGLFSADQKIIEQFSKEQLNIKSFGNLQQAAQLNQDTGLDTIFISEFQITLTLDEHIKNGIILKGRKQESLINQIKSELITKGAKAKEVSYILAGLSTQTKNLALKTVAQFLVCQQKEIIEANQIDLKEAEARGTRGALLDRLMLNSSRIEAMAKGLDQIAGLDDPIGELICLKKRPNGLGIGQRRVPIGVIGIIYEARPNVTADAFGLCLKTSNAVILRGGKEAIRSNMAVVKVIQQALASCQVPPEAVQLVENTDRQSSVELMKLNDYLDVIIPRGGAELIKAVVNNSKVPVIETGAGNCHVYVDKYADHKMAVQITFNAKTQRVSVCNAIETLLIHKDVAQELLPSIVAKLREKNVEIRGDERVMEIIPDAVKATEQDWWTEYLDYIIAVKVVENLQEAIDHINKYGTRNSDGIVTENYSNAQKFMNDIDSAAVYVNASTRFTDGFEFGFGAEIGISTQKMHARGPMGLKELTSYKYVIFGNGQIRDQVL